MSGNAGNPAWASHILLQEVKSAWKATVAHHKKTLKDPEHLLQVLPPCFEDLPETIRSNYGDLRPASAEARKHSPESIVAGSSQVRLRQTHAEHPNNPRQLARPASAGGDLGSQLGGMMAMQVLQQLQLNNLRLFPENMRAPRTEASRAHCGANDSATFCQPRSVGKEPMKAIMDSPWNDSKQKDEKRAETQPNPAEAEKTDLTPDSKLLATITSGASTVETQKAAADAELLASSRQAEAVAGPQTSRPNTTLRKRPASASSGCLKRPAASQKTTRVAVADAAAKKPNFAFEAKYWGSCRAEFYRDKSYLRFWDNAESKWRMIVGSTERGSHSRVCEQLIPHVKQGKSRDSLHRIRSQLL